MLLRMTQSEPTNRPGGETPVGTVHLRRQETLVVRMGISCYPGVRGFQ